MPEEPVLTVRQPWASAIFVAGKDVENRPRRTHYRGPLWIHAGEHLNRVALNRWAFRPTPASGSLGFRWRRPPQGRRRLEVTEKRVAVKE